MGTEKIDHILNYWFDGIDATTILESHPTAKKWFKKSEETDKEIKQKFEGDLIRARKRKYDDWAQTPRGRLALILLFDQVSRNIFRGTPQAFENDLRALEYSLLSLKDGFDEKLSLIERTFLYMPLMHAESLQVQKRSLEYFKRLVEEAEMAKDKNAGYYQYSLTYAQKHYDIIKQFGRFPHRNVILNRKSTLEEEGFLATPNSSF
jgi:uncharacterized protein (DUF924 family)